MGYQGIHRLPTKFLNLSQRYSDPVSCRPLPRPRNPSINVHTLFTNFVPPFRFTLYRVIPCDTSTQIRRHRQMFTSASLEQPIHGAEILFFSSEKCTKRFITRYLSEIRLRLSRRRSLSQILILRSDWLRRVAYCDETSKRNYKIPGSCCTFGRIRGGTHHSSTRSVARWVSVTGRN